MVIVRVEAAHVNVFVELLQTDAIFKAEVLQGQGRHAKARLIGTSLTTWRIALLGVIRCSERIFFGIHYPKMT